MPWYPSPPPRLPPSLQNHVADKNGTASSGSRTRTRPKIEKLSLNSTCSFSYLVCFPAGQSILTRQTSVGLAHELPCTTYPWTNVLWTDNAYVSGLKDDLGFYGNELVQLQTIYAVGAVVGQIPLMFLFPLVPMHWLLPTLDIAWGIFTLLQYRSNSYAELAAYRFLIGWFEVSA
jgi:hypothetical protein